MALAASQIQVPDRPAMESTINGYIAQGFTVQNRGDDFAVLMKRKEFSMVWAIVGFLLCILPLLIYLLVYALEKDQMVEIRVGAGQGQVGGTAAPAEPAALQWSDDGEHWWDGARWRAVREELPPAAPRSPDGHYFYDGTQWRQIPPELRTGATSTAQDEILPGNESPNDEERKTA